MKYPLKENSGMDSLRQVHNHRPEGLTDLDPA